MSGRAISKMECKKLNQTIFKMWEEFDFLEELTIDDKNRLKEFKDNAYVLSMWIKNDTVFYLRSKKAEEQESELDTIAFWLKKQLGASLYQKITTEAFNLDVIKKELEIVSDWKATLDKVVEGGSEFHSIENIFDALEYGLSKNDIKELAIIHKEEAEGSQLRDVIEVLLEELNFHSECSDFASGNYDEYLKD